ncbi:ABC transporter substrate-binding protein [Variovorax sp. LjRoot84]|uniref:ABC transporter substrate-binding protein n=1 Tax=Variovorax sp. LjRoot84 TaxID=3342340 RepID=UPI003ECE4E54
MSILSKFWPGALALCLALPAGAQAPDKVRVGVIGPFTGPAATSGIAMKRAFEFTAKQVNDAGGVAFKGRRVPIELLFEDSQSRPDVGLSAAQKLLTRDNVDVLLAELLHSSVALAIMELAPAHNKVFMSGQPVAIEIAERIERDPQKYRNFWKHDFNSDASSYTLKETVRLLVQQKKLVPRNKTVAFVIEDSDFARANVEYATRYLKQDGWTVLATETVPLAHTDFYPQISKLRAQAPDLLYSIFTSANSGIALVKQIREQDIRAVHIATYYPTLAEFTKGAGKNAEGLVLIPFLFDPKYNAAHKAFAEKIGAYVGTTVSMDHAFGACAAEVLFDAIHRAQDVAPEALNKAFLATDYQCAVGHWVFDPKNHSPKVGAGYLTLPAAQVQDGVIRAIWPPEVPGSVAFRRQD